MKISALIAKDVRNFEGEHIIDLDEGLNVFIGKNNTGKSTLLRIPSQVSGAWRQRAAPSPIGLQRHGDTNLRIGLHVDVSRPFLDGIAPQFWTSLQQTRLRGRDFLVGLEGFSSWARSGPYRVELNIERRGDSCMPALRIPRPPWHPLIWFGAWEMRVASTSPVHFAPEPNADVVVGFRTFFETSPFTSWAHRPFGMGDQYGQHKKRLHGPEESEVQATLTFLKLKHQERFALLAAAIERALPEFGRLDFEEFGTDYKPAFKLNHADQLLTHDLVGSGSWTFLSILTAAHAAVATGAETIVLDEPHLYLHPGLERRLVRELTNEETWKGKAPQLLVATHSPVFLDAAWRKGKVYLLDWKDEKRTKVEANELTKGEIQSQLRNAISVSSISELLYADRVVFVEGASDVKALEVLTDGVTWDGASIRFEPLRSPDNIDQQPFINALRAVSRGFRTGLGTQPVLLLDADKGAKIQEVAQKSGFLVHTVGVNGHDMESMFADVAFLTAYFESNGVPQGSFESKVDEVVRVIVSGPKPVSADDKACKRLRVLHDELLPLEFGNKTDLLEALATFYRSSEIKLPKVEELIARLKGEKP